MASDKEMVGIFIFLLIATFSYAQQENLFFRKDYTYIKETESFYKIHTRGINFLDALWACHLEGSSMFFPEDEYEAKAVINFWTEVQKPVPNVRIGVTSLANDEGRFETIDGRPISSVYEKWAPGEPNNAPPGEQCVEMVQSGLLNDVQCDQPRSYICKKNISTINWNYECNLPDSGYKLDRSVGQCYKFHQVPVTWSEAYATCIAEQSYLVIVNSQEESDALVRMVNKAPRDNIEEDFQRGAVHIGIRKTPRGWITVKGQRLEDTFVNWAPGKPGNAGGDQSYGSMSYCGRFNDINCEQRSFFICEHDV